VASASVHLAEVGTTLASGISHWRLGNVGWHTVAWLAVPGAAGGYVGATLLSTVDGAAMRPWVAALLVAMGVVVVLRFAAIGRGRRRPSAGPAGGAPHPRLLGPLGGVAGFVDAVGGGGWGPLTTPVLMTAGRLEPRRAIGSTSAAEFVVSLAASIGFLTHLGGSAIDPRIVGALLVGGVAVAPLAAWLVKIAPQRAVGVGVGALLVAINVRRVVVEPAALALCAAVIAVATVVSVAQWDRDRRLSGVPGRPALPDGRLGGPGPGGGGPARRTVRVDRAVRADA
jgi:uncharacterized membrane protein YfcA